MRIKKMLYVVLFSWILGILDFLVPESPDVTLSSSIGAITSLHFSVSQKYVAPVLLL